MIIKRKYKTDDCQIIDIKKTNKGDVITQASTLDGLMLHCQRMRKDVNNGFSKKRKFRVVAEIPELTFMAHRDEWMRDPESQKRWLRSEEGEPFLFVKKNSI